MSKALFWDFDGTLLHPNKTFFTALPKALVEFGYAADEKAAKDFMEKTYSWKIPDITYPDQTGNGWWERLFDALNRFYQTVGVSQTDIPQVNARFREILINPKNYALYPDTVEVLKTCMARGYRNFITTNNYPELPQTVEAWGLAEYFEDYIVSSHIGYEKPLKEFFQTVLDRAGNPDISYMIGDNPVADMGGAKRVGITTIFVHNDAPCDHADYRCEDLQSILSIIK